MSAEPHDEPVNLPTIPRLRFLTLKANVRTLRVPSGLGDVMVTLPTCLPRLEVINVVTDAEFEDWYDSYHRPDVDMDLKNPSRLREVQFSISVSGRNVRFNEHTTKKLPMANDAGLLSFSRFGSRRQYHLMRHFSN